jgi:outer membrane lipoprotein
MRILTLTIVMLVISACTTVPEQIQGTYPEIAPARVDPGAFGSSVRWGGVILGTTNKENKTCFEILSRDLDKYLRPELEDQTAGRYIACKQGFYDPLVFSKGREVTMTGQIRNIEVKRLEEFDYSYPLLDVQNLVLWEKRRKVVVYRGFHDPWMWPSPYGRWGWGWGWGHPYYRPFPMHSSGFAETRTLLPDPSIVEPSAAEPFN